ncbi:MAG: response regulator [Desulfococcaceae bacterium]|jgi:DNA-binding response OmpR family regulator/class 3 adenylate cyclase|nr:response regulator [Desulfococcaceae bacterium]
MTDSDLKILIVDDSSLIRGIIRKELEAGGYLAEEAVHGFEALAKASEFRPALITLDVEMPKLNGFDTCRKLREKHYARFFTHCPDNMVPIIFVTSLDTIGDRKKGFELGAMDFITKPFKQGVILDAVNKILRPENRLRDLTALVVNDKTAFRHMVSDCLRREGVSTVEAADGSEAFEIVSRTEGIDIVVSGLQLPGMGGEQLCRKIRKELNLKELPFIILPVVDDKSQLFELFKAGATDYLLQPFVKEEFLARLIVHLERASLNKSLRNTLEQVENFNKTLESTIKRLTHIGASLTSEKNLNKLLEMIVFEARDATNADGGTLYTLKNNHLHYKIVQNKSLNSFLGGESDESITFPPVALEETNVSAFCAIKKEIVSIPNVYENSEFDFSGPRKFDAVFGYKTRSMLVLPLLDRSNEVVGVLQLINSIDPESRQICEFPKNSVEIAYSLSCQAAVSIENALSYEKIEKKNTAFKRFVPNEFLRFMNKNEIEDIQLGEASEAELSVLFSDIRSFTDMSEKMSPEENFRFLNNYLRFIGPVIGQNKGFIDKYIGDAIMALFGGNQSSGAQDAVTAAVSIQETVKVYNKYRRSSGYVPISIGIGINTGRMILGTIGFETRMDSTVIGDTVNLASRVEGLTKKYAVPITITSFTLNSLREPEKFMIREIDIVRVKGKEEAVKVYEVFDSNEIAIRDAKQESLERFNEGISLFRHGQWHKSHMLFAELAEILPGDIVVRNYEEKSRIFMENPPDEHDMIVTKFNQK